MNVCLIGTGYVGLVTGACLSYLGHNVTCVDVDEGKIAALRAGRATIYEPGIEELMSEGIKARRLSFTTELDEGVRASEVIFIAVGTPPRPGGSPDLSYVRRAAQDIGRAMLRAGGAPLFRVVVNKSTVPVGSGNWVEMLIREQIRGVMREAVAQGNGHGAASNAGLRGLTSDIEESFGVVSNPEFLREGTAIRDTLYPDRIVVGANGARALGLLKKLYEPILEQSFEPPAAGAQLARPAGLKSVPLVSTDPASAEMIKYAANAFLAMKISFANEVANICEHTGADVECVMRGIGLDGRIGDRFLRAGVGWGGSCFGKDISALIQIAGEYGYHPELLEAARSVNQRQRRRVVQKLQGELKILKGRTVGLLGLAFKPETDDVRDAPSYDIALDLTMKGARVKVYDPVAMGAFRAQHPELEVTYAPDVRELAADCDALVLVTEWPEFRRLDLPALRRLTRGPLLVDGRNLFGPEEAAAAGFRHVGVGR